MDQKKVLMLAGVLGVLIVAIIIGTVVYLAHSTPAGSSKVVTSTPFPTSQTTVIPSYAPSTIPAAPNPNTKTYSGGNFTLTYPKTWGLLTCSNSKNIELDPTLATDQLKVSCQRAVKPITIIVGSTTSCPGQIVKLGNISVLKSVDATLGRTDYRFCTQTNPVLDISVRYSPSGGVATATTDYSSQVEQIISTASFGSGS